MNKNSHNEHNDNNDILEDYILSFFEGCISTHFQVQTDHFRECSTDRCSLLTSTFGLSEGRRIWPLPICRMHDFIVLRLMVLRYLGLKKKQVLRMCKMKKHDVDEQTMQLKSNEVLIN